MTITNLTVTVTKAEIISTPSPRPIYRHEGERFFRKVECQGQLEDGTPVYFSSPAIEGYVSCPPGAPIAIVGYCLWVGRVKDWVAESEGRAWADKDGPNENKLLSLVKAGDVLDLRAFAYRKTSRAGNEYLSLKNCRIISRLNGPNSLTVEADAQTV